MRTYFIAAAMLLICGCRPPEKPLELPSATVAEIAQDTLGIMLAVYPPAKTRLNLARDPADAFGITLVGILRENGYAVAEYAAPGKASVSSPGDLGFDYALIEAEREKEIRLTVSVGMESLSRLYAVQETDDGTALEAQGYWSRRE